MKNDTPLFDRYRDVYDFFTLVARAGLFDKERNLDNQYFHHKDKGCKLENREGESCQRGNRIYKYQYCLTHNVDVCLCGWQKGFHYGTNSRKLPRPQRQIKNYGRGLCIKERCNKPALALGLCPQHYIKYNRELSKSLIKAQKI
jgi:hypothetical protein